MRGETLKKSFDIPKGRIAKAIRPFFFILFYLLAVLTGLNGECPQPDPPAAQRQCHAPEYPARPGG